MNSNINRVGSSNGVVDRRKGEDDLVIFRLSGYGLAVYTVSLASLGFVASILLSIIFDFESSTSTHCKVANYLPSISAAIGGYTPQKYIWRICIGLHCAPRLLLAFLHKNYYQNQSASKWLSVYSVLTRVLTLLHVIENLALVTLTFVSSSDNYDIHENSFIIFMVSSELYMVVTCLLFYIAKPCQLRTPHERQSFRWKVCLTVVNITSFLLAVYFFFRHNDYCEPGMYTAFAACEYSVVTTNIAFNGLNIINDFGKNALLQFSLPAIKSRVE